LLAPIKDRFTYQDFEKLTQLAQKVSGHESRSQSTKGMYHVWQMMDYLSDSDSDENEIDLAEWNKNTKIVGCSWVKKEARRERYDFDVIKAKKYLTYCCKRNISVYCPITCYHHLKSSRRRSGESGITPRPATLMNAGCS
jgi:hypothetical protein